MRLFRPLSPVVTRPVTLLVFVAWVATLGVLVHRSYVQASTTLAADLARYGSDAQWRGVYYRGEKIGFTVSQTIPQADGFELQEDGRLQMTLLGAHTFARLRTAVRVDRAFNLRSFDFSLDPGTGPVEVSGTLDGLALNLSVKTASGTHTERRELPEQPMLSLNLARRLANGGLVPGATHQWTLFDPATLRNAPVTLTVGRRETTLAGEGRVPAFRVDMSFGGLRTTSWITDTGEVVREESPLGLITVRESEANAQRLAVSGRIQADLLETSAVVPETTHRIAEPRYVRLLRLRLEGADLSGEDLQGAGQTVSGNLVEIVDPQRLVPGVADPDAVRYLAPEPLIESDAPEIREEAERAAAGARGARARAERLTRHVNALLEKKPTVSLPSAREVLRTKVGDCNEHTALYVAMARSIGIPSRIAVGLAYVRGAFYYHAWPEVYLDEGNGRGLWLPVDPTFNQFPADAMHVRLARGGLDRQASIVPLIGRLKMAIVDLELAPDAPTTVVGRQAGDVTPLSISIPRRAPGGCWWSPPPQPGPQPRTR
jgi:transglutaminase-like putative cysteine protease